MAKGHSSRGSAYGSPSSLTSLLSPNQILKATGPVTIGTLPWAEGFTQDEVLAYSDRRRYQPDESIRAPGAVVRSAARIRVAVHRAPTFGFRSSAVVSPYVKFNIPRAIGLCARRRIRKEVIHALGKHGRGGRGGAKPRKRNFWSSVKC